MKNLSYIILDGNLTHDPDRKQTSLGKSVTNFTVAVNHNSNSGEDKEPEDVSYFEIEAWEKMGENCSEYLKKGSKVTVMGNLKQNRWKTNEGENRSKVKVVATSVRFDSQKRKDAKAA
ncbi:single-stranded DNA-binding protein [Leptospira ognonensis]|uniref:Single-stranded DNA-binding protein n=1 Tax=Leptospira ognonensis TaxID=2484945 RepID=A0A4R9K662_9LEPT|nr:single-stranded DNA-binding protein [Leptospira ognonensis]TGL60118.1 single-stranded DNA-binding protein [Leptospira ognonensis]